jgi:hypothetical protein
VKLLKAAIIDMIQALSLLVKTRAAITAFAINMERQLRNRGVQTGDWVELAPETILRGLRETTDQIEAAYKGGDAETVYNLYVALSNFALFGADNVAMEEVAKYYGSN